MKIAIASGKGGTGKTTVATNLAVVAASQGMAVCYIDCDVEEPNGAIFLKPTITEWHPVPVPVPVVHPDKCIGCGLCAEICAYSAIITLAGEILVFPEMCHGCGGCWRVCPVAAICESSRTTGQIEIGQSGHIGFAQGILNVGEPMSPPVINAVKRAAPEADLQIIDAPPGTSCPVVESVHNADFVVLVTEPTPFGRHDLKLAVEMLQFLHRPFGVVINRSDSGDAETGRYCRDNGIVILGEIPDDRRVAEAYSRGEMVVDAVPEYRRVYTEILGKLMTISAAAITAGRAVSC